MKRKLSGKSVALVLGVLLAVLCGIGAVQGVLGAEKNIAERKQREAVRASALASPSPKVFKTELPGEAGFIEYHKSIGYPGSDRSALRAGYSTCSLVRVLGKQGAREQLLIESGNAQDVDRLMYASTHYLCPELKE